MMQMVPPEMPPRVALADGDGLKRLQQRLWLVFASLVTVVVTAWCCTLGWVPAILALMVAKHVLVAILVMGLGSDAVGPANA